MMFLRGLGGYRTNTILDELRRNRMAQYGEINGWAGPLGQAQPGGGTGARSFVRPGPVAGSSPLLSFLSAARFGRGGF